MTSSRISISLGCLLIAASALSIQSCRPEAEPPAFAITDRLLSEEPQELFDSSDLLRSETLARWPLVSASDLGSWQIEHAAEVSKMAAGGLVLSFDRGRRPSLLREVELEAGDVDAVEADVLPFPGGDIRLAWSLDGESFTPEREIRLPSDGRRGTGIVTYRFDLKEHPDWAGTIRGLRLTPGHSAKRAGVREVRAIRTRFDAGSLATRLPVGWKVDLDAELRSARIALPGSPIEWPVTLVRYQRLRFALGTQQNLSAAVTFRVVARSGSGQSLLFEKEVAPGDLASATWLQTEIDLATLEPGAAKLVFETETDSSFDPSQGLPFWGNPELLAPHSSPHFSPRPSNATAPKEPVSNVILISLDTLRADHMSLYGYSRPTTPRLDAWAENSAVKFEETIAPTPSTLYSHASMLSGVWSLRTGVARRGTVPGDLTLLAERLREVGFETLAVTGGGFLHPSYRFHQGFDVYRYWPYRRGMGESAREFESGVEFVESWLSSGPSSPFFLFLHTYEAHSPYRPRQPYLEAFGGPAADSEAPTLAVVQGKNKPTRTWLPSLRTVRQGVGGEAQLGELISYYDAGIAYTDALVGRVLDRLQETGLDRSTLVIVTSDHGESLGEQGLLSHDHLYESNLRVPLLIGLPGGRHGGRRVAMQVSLVDLVPTILELIGSGTPDGLDGRTLGPLLRGETTSFREEAWTYSSTAGLSLRLANRLKYLYRATAWPEGRLEEELYRIDTDPGESFNVSESAEETGALRRRAREALRDQHRGLRLRVSNPSAKTMQGRVRGGVLLPEGTVISPEMSCDCLRRTAIDEASLEIPPETSLTLFFDKSFAPDLYLSGGWDIDEERAGGRESFEASIDLANLEGRWSSVWQNDRWHGATGHASAGDYDDAIQWLVWWQGGPPSEGELVETDPTLLEQLRELGYVE